MKDALQYLRSLVFVGQMYLMMVVIGLAYLPWVLISKEGAYAGCHAYCRWVRWTARWMVGLKTEVRGTPPTGEVIVAAKHQSFLDILLIFGAIPRGRFIMKRQIMYMPVIGQYGLRIGCIPVDRGKRSEAIRKMVADVDKGRLEPGQLIIYPQGTRVAPGVKQPYKVGAGILYKETGQDCVPVATNVGVFWPRIGIMRKPGLAVVEFLPTIPAGLEVADFTARLEQEVEAASDLLLAEAGFTALPEPDAT